MATAAEIEAETDAEPTIPSMYPDVPPPYDTGHPAPESVAVTVSDDDDESSPYGKLYGIRKKPKTSTTTTAAKQGYAESPDIVVRPSPAALRRMEQRSAGRIGTLAKDKNPGSAAQSTAAIAPQPTANAYELTDRIKKEKLRADAIAAGQAPEDYDAEAQQAEQAAAPPPSVGWRVLGAVSAGVSAVWSADPARINRDLKMRRAGVQADTDTGKAVASLISCKIPRVEWIRYGVDLEVCAVWTALDDIAAACAYGEPQLLDRLAECGWKLADICEDPRSVNNGEAWWNTFLLWGFTGEMVAQGIRHPRMRPWFDMCILIYKMKIGLPKLHEDADVTIEDLIRGGVPAGFVAQFGTRDEMPSPIPYMCMVMGMTPHQFVRFKYTIEEWTALLALDEKIAKDMNLLDDPQTMRALERERGWTPELYAKHVCGKTDDEIACEKHQRERKEKKQRKREAPAAGTGAFPVLPPPSYWEAQEEKKASAHYDTTAAETTKHAAETLSSALVECSIKGRTKVTPAPAQTPARPKKSSIQAHTRACMREGRQ